MIRGAILAGQVVLFALCASLAVCHYVYSRVWWQETMCAYTLLWLPLVALICGWSIYQIGTRRGGHSLLFATATVGLGLIAYVGSQLWPYVYYSGDVKLGSSESVPVGVFHAHVAESEEAVVAFHRRLTEFVPEIVVLHGASAPLVARLGLTSSYPFMLTSAGSYPLPIRVFSKFPLGLESRADLGMASLAAVFVTVELDRDVPLELGSVSLIPSFSEEAFESSKITSRRLASLMRNSILPRMVVGDFIAPPLSQIISMYNRQARMRSVFFGEGMRRLFEIQSVVVPEQNVNAFISAGIEVEGVVLLSELHPINRSLFVAVKVPRATIVPVPR